jgi:hypothetical protein
MSKIAISNLVLVAACAFDAPATEPDQPAGVPDAVITGPAPDQVVTCDCHNSNSCPVIASLSVNGGSAIPAYCNVNTPGTQGTYGVLYQCMEYSNRFLVEGLGQPIIHGVGARDMCGNADRSHYDVYTGDSVHVPVPGDVLVWDGNSSNPYGHTAVVSKVNASNLEFVEQNFGYAPHQYPIATTPRHGNFFGTPNLDPSLPAKCIIHPKVLDQPTTAGGTVVALAANNGQYVSSQGGTSGTAIDVFANRDAVAAWEKFRLVPVGGGYALACQGASAPAYYVSAENGGGGAVHCNRTAIGPWETFKLEWKSGFQVAFRTANGHYLSAQNGGGSGVDATRTAVGPWETFATAEGLAAGTCTSAEYAAQNVNGTSFWTCQGASRYVCDGAGHKVVEACATGCRSEGAGVDDECNGLAVAQCTPAEFAAQDVNSTSFWTCQGNSRYVCDAQGNKVSELCPAGCAAAGTGADDQCR